MQYNIILFGDYMDEQKEAYELVHISKPPYEVLSTKWLSYKDVLPHYIMYACLLTPSAFHST